MDRIFIILGSAIAGLTVAIGAFGAHALKATLEETNRLATFETAVKYQMYHALAIILLAILLQRVDQKLFVWAGYSFIIGILLFSGSLFILSVSNISKWGMVTPFGGLAFILGWIFIIIGAIRANF